MDIPHLRHSQLTEKPPLQLLNNQTSVVIDSVLPSVMQAVLRRRYVQAALAACAAMAVRQNSAVWAAFSLGVRPSLAVTQAAVLSLHCLDWSACGAAQDGWTCCTPAAA